MEIGSRRKNYILAFVIGCLPFLVSALSFMARNNGIFYLFGDFNSQQLPFMIHISDALSDFKMPLFDFNAGTGIDFVDAYSFYNLFNPFTFIYVLLPAKAVIYAVPFVMTLKFGCCSLAAYIYISRFCKTDEYAMTGALLYTYSGAQMVNLVFHYLDSFALFPLLLAALEAAVNDKRRGVFGAAVFICAITNYYLFGIEVIFIILYFFIRFTDKSFRIGVKDFFCLALESVLGVMAAGIVIFPAIVFTISNPRLGLPFYSIKQMLLYETPWRYPRILQAIFMMPDVQGYTNFFPDYKGYYPNGSRWSSQAMYIPFFGVSGFMAYMSANKKSWQTKLITICLIIAFIPVLNSIFSIGSSQYYARWMFAPILIMSAMTASALENEPKHFKPGLAINAAVVLLIGIFTIIFPMDKLALWESLAFFSNAQKWTQLALTLSGIIIVFLLIFVVRRDATYKTCILASTVLFTLAFSETTILFDMGETQYPKVMTTISEYPDIEKKEYGSRIATDAHLLNMNLVWGVAAPYCFTTAEITYLYEYCNALDISATSYIMSDPMSQCLLSVEEQIKYNDFQGYNELLQDIVRTMEVTDLFQLYKEKGIYAHYKNTNFIPMGFCYDYCISKDDFLSLDSDIREYLMIKAMVVDDVSAVSEFLEPIPENEIYILDDKEFSDECAKRAETYAYKYTTDDRAYNAEIELEEPELVFFSVIYNKNFTAYVDGEKTDIIKANVGFQAVPVPAGKHTIRVEYHNPWHDIGIAASLIGITGLIIYTVVCFILHKKHTD